MRIVWKDHALPFHQNAKPAAYLARFAFENEKFEELFDHELALAELLVAKGVARDRVFRELMKTAKPPVEPEKKNVPAPTPDNPSRAQRTPGSCSRSSRIFNAPSAAE